MELLKESDFRKELKSAPRKGYLFFGEEDYLKAHAVRLAREVICPDPTLAFFNELRLDALEYTPQKLLDALTPLPMMADQKLVTLTGLNLNSMNSQNAVFHELDDLCDVLQELPNYDYNLLILSVTANALEFGSLPNKPSPLLSQLSQYLTPVYFEPCTGARLAAWVQKHFLHYGVEAPAALCHAMGDYCGHSMFVLANEIEKLCYYLLAHGRTVATEEDMRTVCTTANEYGAFAFTNAIMANKHREALDILEDYRFRRTDPLKILGEVSGVICNLLTVQSLMAQGLSTADIGTTFKPALHEYRVRLLQGALQKTTRERLEKALDACSRADLSLKNNFGGGTMAGYAVLEQLICTL